MKLQSCRGVSSGSNPSVLGKGYKVRAASRFPKPHTYPASPLPTLALQGTEVCAAFIKWIGKTYPFLLACLEENS